MNERAREVLVKAALDGVPQWFRGVPTTAGDRAKCAVIALSDAIPVNADIYTAYDLSRTPQRCSVCDWSATDEALLLIHLNDTHRFDFLTIARKVGGVSGDAA